MKKAIPVILIFAFCFSCTPTQNDVDRTFEDGVEVVINHLEPYRVKGEPSTFSLTEEFRIDTEKEDIAEMGMADIGAFDIDGEGRIYILSGKNKESAVFEFDKEGNFIHSFGSLGQGPGEFQSPTYLGIDSRGMLNITDFGKRKLITFDPGGNFEREISFDNRMIFIHPLENGKHLMFYQIFFLPGGDDASQAPLSLWTPEFKEVKVLGILTIPNYSKHKKRKGTPPLFCWSVSGENIFFGNKESAYEISVFDLEGKIIRKITKQHKSIPVPEEYKKERMENLHPREREITYFPENFPPYRAFFSDDAGRLFVMTYEKGAVPGEYIFDIFNSRGVFIGRKSHRGFYCAGGRTWVNVINENLYGIVEKESGYKALVVYKIAWE